MTTNTTSTSAMVSNTDKTVSVEPLANSNRHAKIKGAIKKVIPRSFISWVTNSRAIVATRARVKGWMLRNQPHDEVYGDDYFSA